MLKSKDKLSYGTLASEKVRGVVCSENRGAPPVGGSDKYLDASCTSTLNQVKANNRPD